MKVVVRYGSGNLIDSTVVPSVRALQAAQARLVAIASQPQATFGDILNDDVIQSGLTFGDNVEVHVGGMAQTSGTRLSVFGGDVSCDIHDKACEKRVI